MKSIITLSIASLIIILMAFQQPKPEKQDLQRDFTAYPNDSVFRIDSLKAEYIIKNYFWKYIDSGQSDSLKIVIDQIISLGTRLNQYKDDSLTYVWKWGMYGEKGSVIAWEGKVDEGLKYFLESIEMKIKRFGPYYENLTENYVVISNIYEQKGDYDKAIDYIFKSLYVTRRTLGKNHYYVGNNYTNLGLTYKDLNKYELSNYCFSKAIDNYSSQTPPRIIAVISRNYSMLENYIRMGEVKKAKEVLIRIQEYREKVLSIMSNEDKLKCSYYITLSHAFISLAENRLADAENYFNKTIEISEKVEISGYIRGIVFQTLGELCIQKKKYLEAKNYFDLVVGIYKNFRFDSYKNVSNAKLLIGDLYVQMDSFELALNTYNSLLNDSSSKLHLSEFTQNPDIKDIEFNEVALSFLSKKAFAFYTLYKKTGKPEDLKFVVTTFSKFDSLSQKFRTNFRTDYSKALRNEKAVPVYKLGIEAALELFEITKDKTYFGYAWDWNEKLRSSILLESLRAVEGKTFLDLSPDILTRERQLKIDISLFEKQIFDEEAKENTDLSLISKWHYYLDSLKNDYDHLLTDLESRYPQYYALKYNLDIAPMQEIQNKLKPGTVLVEYFLTDTSLLSFWINKDEIQYFYQKVDSTFYEKTASFNRLIHQYPNTPGSSDVAKADRFTEYIESAHYLYDKLVGPGLEGRNYKDLVIIPDGIITQIPFQALLEPGISDQDEKVEVNYRNLPYLVKRYNFQYEYSATIFAGNWKSSTAPRNYLGFAPVYTGAPISFRSLDDSLNYSSLYSGLRDGFSTLAYNKAEIEAAKEIWNGDAYVDTAATEANFKKEASRYRLLHLAMHSVTNDRNPLYSLLVFSQNNKDSSQDNALYAYELYNTRLNADLAVLSACNTGAGKFQRGEGVLSLSRAFKYAGCPNILMSLWNVNDFAANEVMGSYFKKLKSGDGKASALQEAQIEYLGNAKEEYTHPFYWATFVLVGDDLPIDPGWGNWPQLVMFFIIFCGVFIYFLFKKSFNPLMIQYRKK